MTTDPALTTPRAGTTTPIDRPTRVLLVVSSVLTGLATLSLLGGAAHTDEAFAWTIQPPIAAAFLGAAYGAGLVLVLLTLAAGTWEQTRWLLTSVLVFVLLALVATILHFDRLHLPGETTLGTSVAWLWLFVYVVLPPVMVAVMARAERNHRRSTQRTARPETTVPAFRAALLLEGVVLGAAGVALFLQVTALTEHWPWLLTPFIARVTGAWLVAFAVAAFLAVRIDVSLLRPGTISSATFGALELLVLVLHPDDVQTGTGLVVYIVVALGVVATGLWGSWLSARAGGSLPQIAD